MSQVTVTTTTPPTTVVCSGAATTTKTLTMLPTHEGQEAALCQHDVVVPPYLMLMDTMRCIVGLTTVLQQQP